MKTALYSSRRWIKYLAMAAFWTLVALWYGGQLYFTSAQIGWRRISWSEALGSSLADWYTYAPLSIAVVWLATHYRI